MREIDFLFAEGQYTRCLEVAESRLATEGLDDSEEAAICLTAARCRLALGDYPGARAWAERGSRAARAAEALDLLGSCLATQGVAEVQAREDLAGQANLEAYLSLRPLLNESLAEEGSVLYHLGLSYQRLGKPNQASLYLGAARQSFLAQGQGAEAEACRRTLVNTLLQAADLAAVLPLLEAGAAYAEAHPADPEAAWVNQAEWGEYYFCLGEHQASIDVGFRLLDAAEAEYWQARAHLLLCRNALALKRPKDALNFALGARVAAIDGRVYDLEFEASAALFEILNQYGYHLLAELADEYRRVGLDLFQYISERSFQRLLAAN